jgi:hypothetical protein
MALACGQQVWSTAGMDLNPTIKTADYVVVARVIGSAQWGQRQWVDARNELREERDMWVATVPMQTVLSLKGDLSGAFTYVEAAGIPFKPDISATRLAPAGQGSLVLLWLYKQNADHLFRSFATSNLFRADSSTEYEYAHPDSVPVLPESNYVLEGQTPVERYCSILVQAYAIDPGGERSRDLLSLLSAVRPWWKIAEGRPILRFPDWDGPSFFDFAKTKLIPRLLATQGDDILRKLRANYYAYWLAGDDQFAAEHRRLVDRLDATWPDPHATNLIEGIIGDRQYVSSKLNARVASVRIAALARVELKRENLPTVLARLRSDESFDLRIAAVRWLDWMKSQNLDQFRDAPAARINRAAHLIENRQQILDYWTSH